jgi:hypothetical protein
VKLSCGCGWKDGFENFYWRALSQQQDDLKTLGEMPTLMLEATVCGAMWRKKFCRCHAA